ncbi:MAG: hypothetical protein K0U45_00215 [Alphaproteobacteria bacterium]|nr:hypothetical protein [Alphaproteobacteria bacterium]
MIFYGARKIIKSKAIKSLIICVSLLMPLHIASAQKNGTITLILGHNLQEDSPLLELFLKRWANYFTQVTNNRGKIIFQGPQDGTFGKDKKSDNANIDSLLRSGKIDIAFVNLFDTPESSFFYSKLFALPFITSDTAIASHVFWDIANDYLRQEYQNLQLLSLHIDPYTMLHYGERPPIQLADSPINTILFPEDLQGRVVATNHTYFSKFINSLNGTSIDVPIFYQEKARIFTEGHTDAFGLNHSDINHEQLSFLTRHTVFEGIGTPYYFAFNEDIFNLLPREWRKILTSSLGGKNLVDFAVEVTDHIHRTELQKLQRRNDLIIKLNAEQKHRWRNSANLYISDFFKDPKNINDEALVVIFNLMQERIIQMEKRATKTR